MPKTKKLSQDYEHKDDYQEDLSAHDNYIAEFDAYEAMLVSKTYDSVSRTVKSGITDGSAATIAIERAARVVGQLPSGVVKAAGKKDTGKGILMDIIRQKWIYPNANAQFPFFIKLRMWQLYSSVYGYMPMFYDWHVSPSGYIGPDCWLWSPRNFIPQAGRPSIADMDYVHAISYVSPRYLEELLDEDDSAGWDKTAIKQLLDDNKKTNREVDTSRDTFTARDRTSQSIRGQVALVTRYEAGKDGHWITFSPDGWRVIRDIPNPHKSAKIPFVIKPGIPLFDSFYNLGDFQRNKPLQFAMDGLTNFYFEGIKMNIFPPTIINANSVIKHTINMKPGAIWQELAPNSARRMETSTAGLSTYQSAMTQLKGALLNQAGTTDTAVNQEAALDPGFGKTPEALKMHQARESTRDNQDRTFLETALEELIDGMLGLIPNIATENIPIDLFSEEIEEIIKQGYGDVLEIVEEKKGKKVPKSKTNTASIFEVNESGESAKLTIKPNGLKNVHYKFNLDAQSTAKLDKEQQRQSLLDFLKLVGQFQNELMELRQEGKGLRWEHIFNAYGLLSDVPELQEVFGEVDTPPQPQQQPQQPGQPQQPQQPPEQPPAQPTPQTQSPIQPFTVAGQQFNDPNLGAMAQQLAEQGGIQ